jgi:hypothetical protein
MDECYRCVRYFYVIDVEDEETNDESVILVIVVALDCEEATAVSTRKQRTDALPGRNFLDSEAVADDS